MADALPLPVGTRVRLIDMPNDPNPVQPGTLGTVHGGVVDAGWHRTARSQIWVKWDDGRTLSLLPGIDRYEVVNDDPED